MSITIPNINNTFDVSDIILEQKILCEHNIATIKQVAKVRTDREINDEINRRIRIANDFLGMGGSRKTGCLYFEPTTDNNSVCEHVIPVAELVKLFLEGKHSFETIVFYPIACISKAKDNELRQHGLSKKGFDFEYPFKRYKKAEIKIYTHFNEEIDPDTWSMQKHWDLLFRTEELKEIIEKITLKNKYCI